jgi:DNA-binding beta-propeller fold protein YncE
LSRHRIKFQLSFLSQAMKILLITVCGTCLAFLTAQAQIVAIQPSTAPAAAPKPSETLATTKRRLPVDIPVLGFLASPGTAELQEIVGTAANPRLGELLSAPATAEQVYLSPRQTYALIEERQDAPLKLWVLWHAQSPSESSLIPIAAQGVLARPELVGFSPSGRAAALYSKTAGKMQVLTGLPGSVALSFELGANPVGTLKAAAVSDDGLVVAVETVNEELYVAVNGGQWRLLPGVTPRAWSFLPNSHDLLCSDSGQNALLIARNVDTAPAAPALIASGLQPDHLAVTKDGATVAAFDSSQGLVWLVSLRSGAVTPVSPGQAPTTLVALRDGHTFLLSSSPNVSLANAGNSVEITADQSVMGANR